MTTVEKRIFLRLITMSILLMTGYIFLLGYLQRRITEEYSIESVVFISILYVFLIFLVWIRERNWYFNRIMNKKRISNGNVEYILCPSCKSIQEKGNQSCSKCNDNWILCAACEVPFESGSQVLVAPCCGLGFHYEHFEVVLRETGHCPHCGSDLAIKTTNW